MSKQACDSLREFAQACAERARYGFAGEKPIAVWAMVLASCEGPARISGRELLRTHQGAVRAHFLRLAARYGRMQDAASSWSVITGRSAELQTVLRAAPAADLAFAGLDPADVQALDAWFRTRAFPPRTPPARESAASARVAATPLASPPSGGWLIRSDAAHTVVEAWSPFRLPFEPHGEREAFRDQLRHALEGLSAPVLPFVEAVYVCPALPENCDVENVLFYNVGAAAFQHVARDGLSFRYEAAAPEPMPDGGVCNHYVRYRVLESDARSTAWTVDGTIRAQLPAIAVASLNSSTKPWELWRAVRRHFGNTGASATESEITGCFGLDVQLCVPQSWDVNAASYVKPLFDGIVSALQQPPGVPEQTLRLVATRTGESMDVLAGWFSRRGPVTVSCKCPVEPYRDSARWHPDDARLRAGRVVVKRENSQSIAMSITVYSLP